MLIAIHLKKNQNVRKNQIKSKKSNQKIKSKSNPKIKSKKLNIRLSKKKIQNPNQSKKKEEGEI